MAVVESFLVALGQILPRPRFENTLARGWKSSADAERYSANRSFRKLFPDIDLRDKSVLEVGCGLGGRSAYYLDESVKFLTGIEIDENYAQMAHQYLTEAGLLPDKSFRIIVGDAAQMPLESDSVDVVLCTNTLEHVDRPREVLQECARVIAPGGLVVLHFPPYFSPWGAHVSRWLALPWCQALVKEQTLINAIIRLERKIRFNEKASFVRLDLEGLERLPHVNHITVADFDRYLKEVDLEIVRRELVPVGMDILPVVRPVLQPLAHSRLLREYATSKVVCVLRKSTK